MSGISKIRRSFKILHQMLIVLRKALYDLVLSFFRSTNRRIRSRLRVWYMKKETSEHFYLLTKVFFWLIFPASILYVSMNLYYLGQNSFDSMIFGFIIFFYSNFLPDLPSIFRKKRGDNEAADLVWYKKYALLWFAPLFIWLLFSGIRIKWKTTENFHNLKSLAAYGTFLLLLGFFMFGEFPISSGDIIEIISISIYGMAGYLTHLRVDKIL